MLKRIIVRLKHDITKIPGAPDQFITDLSELAGVGPEEIYEPHIRSGCTLFDGVLDRAAVERVVELFDQIQRVTVTNPEVEELRQFVAKWKVEVFVDDENTKDVRVKVDKVPWNDRGIVFVHGLGSDHRCFGQLPKFVGDSLSIPTHLYEYPTSKYRKCPSVSFVARNLDNWVRNRFSGRMVGFVAHSLGGLVVRKLAALQLLRAQCIDIAQVTLVASPTEGAAAASLAKSIPGLTNDQVKELSPEGPFLIELNDGWSKWCELFVPSRCHLGTIYGVEDKWVSPVSASGNRGDAVPLFDVDHFTIVEPRDGESEIVKTIARFVRESRLNGARLS